MNMKWIPRTAYSYDYQPTTPADYSFPAPTSP
ncbi:hypothetical protein Caci_7405 [Catenulispora acidiphila DSM 44928]|uniref:Uncharacterized protein n=1 Tax=Catenulispora acidiphila (strain DSM 44928 / JCM 14897 / NBRC 102108 / NRRL B-24433 / ID139908) TaxID=479433 RepID=C7Q9R2_CATAD|nr:hypothetical protein Caci_7405 [Catenulispora acidiphila DSM 44928]